MIAQNKKATRKVSWESQILYLVLISHLNLCVCFILMSEKKKTFQNTSTDPRIPVTNGDKLKYYLKFTVQKGVI